MKKQNIIILTLTLLTLLILSTTPILSLSYNLISLKESTLTIKNIDQSAKICKITIDNNLAEEIDISDIRSEDNIIKIDLSSKLNFTKLSPIKDITLDYTETNQLLLNFEIPNEIINKIINITIYDDKNNELKSKDFIYEKDISKLINMYISDTSTKITSPYAFDLTNFPKGVSKLYLNKSDTYLNTSDKFEISIYNIEPILDSTTICLEDSTQDYSYDISINNTIKTDNPNLESYLIDTTPPQTPVNLNLDYTTLCFDQSLDYGNDYTISIKAKGNTHANFVNNTITTNISSGLSHYNYELYSGNKLIKKDTLVETKIPLKKLTNGNYKILLSAVDFTGNESDKAELNFYYENPYAAKDNLIDSFLYTTGNISEEDIELLKNNLYLLSYNALKTMASSGLRINLTSEDLRNYYSGPVGGELSGLFSPTENILYISNWRNYGYIYINKATLHEVGHFFDQYFGGDNYYSNSADFHNIYLEEKNHYSTSHYKSNPQEYFAKSFEDYYLNPSLIMYNAPKTYETLNKILY